MAVRSRTHQDRLRAVATMISRGARRTDANQATASAHAGSMLKLDAVLGRHRLIGQPSSRTGENSPYGMIGGIEGNVGIIRSPVRASILSNAVFAALHEGRSWSGFQPPAIAELSARGCSRGGGSGS
jgi:hypothetical protein